jgi:hypothetical protein
MTFFSIFESFFFLSLGMSFFLILLMVYYFKKRVDILDNKYETLADISKTIVKELELIREIPHSSMFLSPQNLTFPKLHTTNAPDARNDSYGTNINISTFPTETNFFSSSMSNPFEELYKKIIISNDMLESDQETEPVQYKINDTVEVDDLDSYISDNDNDNDNEEEEEEEDYTEDYEEEKRDRNEEDVHGMQEETIENVILDAFTIHTLPIPATVPGDLDVDGTVHVMKMDDIDNTEGSVLTVEPDIEQDTTKMTKSTLQKMTVQMLRTIAIRDGICTDPSKFKKLELINMILDST